MYTQQITKGCLVVVVLFWFVTSVQSQVKILRGSIGDKDIEMRLTFAGSKVSGTYFYDRFKQDISLEGSYDAKGQLELMEGAGKRKTGKFVCLKEPEAPDTDLECEWSRPDGTGKALVYLVEQGIQFKTAIKITPTVFRDPKTRAEASYPQFSGAELTPSLTAFNSLVESKVKKAIKDFEPETISGSHFDTTYNVMFADEDIVSVELSEYIDVGASHPNTLLWTVNYDLKRNKEITLGDVFKPGVEYQTTIAEFVTNDINRRVYKMDADEARRNKQPLQKRDEPMMTIEQLPPMDTFALSPKGFVVYFDFPHVIAVFNKTIVPYSVITRYLRADGIVPPIK